MYPVLNSCQRHLEFFSLPLAFSSPFHQALGTVFDKVKLSFPKPEYLLASNAVVIQGADSSSAVYLPFQSAVLASATGQ